MRLYVASSWRNPYQPNAVELLRKAGHDVVVDEAEFMGISDQTGATELMYRMASAIAGNLDEALLYLDRLLVGAAS